MISLYPSLSFSPSLLLSLSLSQSIYSSIYISHTNTRTCLQYLLTWIFAEIFYINSSLKLGTLFAFPLFIPGPSSAGPGSFSVPYRAVPYCTVFRCW